MPRILVVENDQIEVIRAWDELFELKYDFESADTLAAAEEKLQTRPDAVLTDLFFSIGPDITRYVGEILEVLPVYEAFVRQRYDSKWMNNPVRLSLAQVAQTFGMSVEEYVPDVMGKLDTPQVVMESAKRVVKEQKEYDRFLEFIEEIRTGENFPSGIYVSRMAKELGIPCAIVTSTYHHDTAFEPIRGMLSAPYTDTLVDGKKDWAGGIGLIRQHI